jgi:hypothetical protein
MNVKAANIIAKLAAGEAVINKEGGNSMIPLIYSKQPYKVEPVNHSLLEKGDIVYAKVNGRIYTHLITALKQDEVQIGNNHGHINGWTKLSNVYGIVTEVDGEPILKAKTKVKI